jgi:SPP1 gp7 family putative phage head morphogenesis protein
VTAINEHTRSELQRVIRLGVEAKEGPVPIAKRIQEATAFNELRAETVSRTETMFVYNDAALGSYRQLGVQEVEAIDGDADPECAARNGLVLPIGEARGITDHPNGTLDWIPVV